MSGQVKAIMRFTILGCGSSPGVPRIHGDWGACDPEDPKNRRTRCSLLVERISETGKTSVVVDTSPDFRQQMLSAGVQRLDGVLYTHTHADHVNGIDDLRQYALVQRERIKVHGDAPTLAQLKSTFGYCFEAPEGSMYPPICESITIEAGKTFHITGEGGRIDILPVLQIHGPIHSLGFRIGNFAYSPDISDVPAQSISALEGLDCWVIDALQYRTHISHFSLGQALEWIDRMKPKQALLTHMHIPLDYATVLAETPDHVAPAHDMLTIEYDVT
jgi:phosphoribosyl 1,2-cyclic phosphate phosphodiesterase